MTQQTLIPTGPTVNRHRSYQSYETPLELIRAVEARFGKITFDLAASEENKKADRFYSESDDALSKPWISIGGILFLNPPFGNIAPWAERCSNALGAKILFLTPASVGANWFRDYVHRKALVLALNGRIQFEGATEVYPKDCLISAYNFQEPGFDVWKWK